MTAARLPKSPNLICAVCSRSGALHISSVSSMVATLIIIFLTCTLLNFCCSAQICYHCSSQFYKGLADMETQNPLNSGEILILNKATARESRTQKSVPSYVYSILVSMAVQNNTNLENQNIWRKLMLS